MSNAGTASTVHGGPCCFAGAPAHLTVNEVFSYRIFMKDGKENSTIFATAIADPKNKYNPCLVPFAIQFLKDPDTWHEKYAFSVK